MCARAPLDPHTLSNVKSAMTRKVKQVSRRSCSITEGSEVLNLELLIRKSPQSVRAWWTDLPDDYTAKDPREQPYRILTTRHLENGRELRTYWKLPDGSTPDFQEILKLNPDGTWQFDIPNTPVGIHLFDEFRTESTPDGTKLLIHSTLTPKDPSATTRIAMLKEFMITGWKLAAEICERDAP